MKISLRNIGKVKEADVEINGITVIAGENNTGKSTVGKALFSVFNSFYNLTEKIEETRETMLYSAIRSVFSEHNDGWSIDGSSVVPEILHNTEKYLNPNSITELKMLISDNVEPDSWIFNEDDEPIANASLVLNDTIVSGIMNRCNEILNVSEKEIFIRVLQRQMDAEFSAQITNMYTEASANIGLYIKDKEISINLSEHKIKNINAIIQMNTQVIYYDNPLILNDLGSVRNRYAFDNNLKHNNMIKTYLLKTKTKNIVQEAIQETIVDKRLFSIIQKLNDVSPGELDIIGSQKIVYKLAGQDNPINIENLSTGMKSFVIIKTLLSKGYLEEKGTIILDEPEVHLHPEWQLVFAELIVLLQKEFNLHVLLNTHSPYFLNAIEVYSVKYNISEKCKYYLAKNEDNMSIISDVTDNIELIYEKLAGPLQLLENMRWRDD